MSVIVTGMDIPKSCGGCNASGTGVCRKWFDFKEIGSKRSEHCPLKSVDGLVEKITEYRNKISAGEDEFNVGQLWGIDEVTEIIKEYCGMGEVK